ncbi:MAG: hypothetical protein ACRD5H_09060, partial [Nitrososphaerales archaeon]
RTLAALIDRSDVDKAQELRFYTFESSLSSDPSAVQGTDPTRISLSCKVVGKVNSTKYSPEYLAKVSASSIPIDDNVLDMSPRLREALEGADEIYRLYHLEFDQYFTVITKSELDSMLLALPNQQKVVTKTELVSDFSTNTNSTATRILIPLQYNDTYYWVGASYLSQ